MTTQNSSYLEPISWFVLGFILGYFVLNLDLVNKFTTFINDKRKRSFIITIKPHVTPVPKNLTATSLTKNENICTYEGSYEDIMKVVQRYPKESIIDVVEDLRITD